MRSIFFSRRSQLGAGLGLAGLAACATLGLATTLTDRPEVLPLLRDGIATNGLDALARAAPLEWGDAGAARALGAYGLVLASDCVYETELAQPLVATIAALLAPAGCALLAYDEAIGRPAALAAVRAEAASAGLAWEALDPAQGEAEGGAARYVKAGVKLVRLTQSQTESGASGR